MAPANPSRDILEQRKTVGVGSETVTNISSTDFPGHYVGEDHSWDVKEFAKNFQVKYYYNKPYDASFSLIGIDASVANAFRRILLADIPILAIDQVFFNQNTSVIQDEVLAQRLGLVPLTGKIEALDWLDNFPMVEPGEKMPYADQNCVMLKLEVQCTWKEGASKDEKDPKKLYENANVYARDLKWLPFGRQVENFLYTPIKAVNPDILLAKMRPGQEIELECLCIKGFGSDHAKFSAVATATYRLMPKIDILRPIIGADAVKFKGCFPKGVIGLQEVSQDKAQTDKEYEGRVGEEEAVVEDAFKDTVSRECLRHEEFKGKVKLGRVQDHFIFSVESTGQLKSDELFLRAVEILKLKCAEYSAELKDADWT